MIIMYYVSGPLSLVQSGLSVLYNSGYSNIKCVSSEPPQNPKTEMLNIMDIIRTLKTTIDQNRNNEIILMVVD